jgi:hypothetical protein
VKKPIIAGLIVALLLLSTTFISAASACKVQPKESFTITTIGMGSGGTVTKLGNSNLLFTKGEAYTAFFIEVDIGTNPAILPDPSLLKSSTDSILNTIKGIGTDRVTETIVFADGSTLVLHAIEYFTGCLPPYTSFKGSGYCEGYGTGSLSSVKFWGTTSFYISMTQGMVNTFKGTVIGWPT